MARIFRKYPEGNIAKKAGGYLRLYPGAENEDRMCISIGGGDPFVGYIVKINADEARRLRDYINEFLA